MSAIDQITSSFGGSSAPFVPTDIAGLTGWWKADSLVLSDDDRIATWGDDSGNGNDLTQGTGANQPVFKTGIINGLPVVRWGDPFVTHMSTPSIPAIAAWTVFFVGKSVDASAVWLLGAGADTTAILQGFSGTDWDFFNGSFHPFGTVSSSVFQVLTCATGSSTTGAWILGTSFSLSISEWRGDLAEIFIYNTLLSGADQTQCQNYLATKYAL